MDRHRPKLTSEQELFSALARLMIISSDFLYQCLEDQLWLRRLYSLDDRTNLLWVTVLLLLTSHMEIVQLARVVCKKSPCFRAVQIYVTWLNF